MAENKKQQKRRFFFTVFGKKNSKNKNFNTVVECAEVIYV